MSSRGGGGSGGAGIGGDEKKDDDDHVRRGGGNDGAPDDGASCSSSSDDDDDRDESDDPNAGPLIAPLPSGAVSRLVSGQAVSDLSGAVKELLDNALDAGATTVRIKLVDRGLESIEVSDDGEGVPRASRPLLAMRHATSKIREFDDLYRDGGSSGVGGKDTAAAAPSGSASQPPRPRAHLPTLGFRGEALFSLASISSSLIVTTRTVDEDVAQRLTFGRDGYLLVGDPSNVAAGVVARKVGTTVTVSRLFDALPVRRADLIKRATRQREALIKMLQGYGMLCRGVRIHVVDAPASNGGSAGASGATKRGGGVRGGGGKGRGGSSREVMCTSDRSRTLADTVTSVLGSRFAAGMIPITVDLTECVRAMDDERGLPPSAPAPEEGGWRIEGLVSKSPTSVVAGGGGAKVGGSGRAAAPPATNMQTFGVNGRPVDLPSLGRALGDAWRSADSSASLASGRSVKPACALELVLPGRMYDVNLSPDKREVLLNEEGRVCAALRREAGRLWGVGDGGGGGEGKDVGRTFDAGEVERTANESGKKKKKVGGASSATWATAAVTPLKSTSASSAAAPAATATGRASTSSLASASTSSAAPVPEEKKPTVSLEARRLAHLRALMADNTTAGTAKSTLTDDACLAASAGAASESSLGNRVGEANEEEWVAGQPPPGHARMRRRNAFVNHYGNNGGGGGSGGGGGGGTSVVASSSMNPVAARPANGLMRTGGGMGMGMGAAAMNGTGDIPTASVYSSSPFASSIDASTGGRMRERDRDRDREKERQQWNQARLEFARKDSSSSDGGGGGGLGGDIQRLEALKARGGEAADAGASASAAADNGGVGASDNEDGSKSPDTTEKDDDREVAARRRRRRPPAQDAPAKRAKRDDGSTEERSGDDGGNDDGSEGRGDDDEVRRRPSAVKRSAAHSSDGCDKDSDDVSVSVKPTKAIDALKMFAYRASSYDDDTTLSNSRGGAASSGSSLRERRKKREEDEAQKKREGEEKAIEKLRAQRRERKSVRNRRGVSVEVSVADIANRGPKTVNDDDDEANEERGEGGARKTSSSRKRGPQRYVSPEANEPASYEDDERSEDEPLPPQQQESKKQKTTTEPKAEAKKVVWDTFGTTVDVIRHAWSTRLREDARRATLLRSCNRHRHRPPPSSSGGDKSTAAVAKDAAEEAVRESVGVVDEEEEDGDPDYDPKEEGRRDGKSPVEGSGGTEGKGKGKIKGKGNTKGGTGGGGGIVTLTKSSFGTMSIIGQFNLGFILARDAATQQLWILDQHACDEKRNFERLVSHTTLHEQRLLRPLWLDLSPSEENCVLDHTELFEKNGFRFEYDGTRPPRRRLALTALPHSGSGGDGRKAVQFGPEDVGALCALLGAEGESSSSGLAAGSGTGADGGGLAGNNAIRRYAGADGHHVTASASSKSGTASGASSASESAAVIRLPKAIGMFASRACRHSIMIGTSLSDKEMTRVVRRMEGVAAPWDCPHGRPTMRHVRDLAECLLEDEREASRYVAGPALAVEQRMTLSQASQSDDGVEEEED